MEEKIENINPNNLLLGENSRWRTNENLQELMEGIKQVGIIQPIVARKKDKMVICGNRRVAASIKLSMTSVPVRFLDNISDKELLLMNLQENLQRKDISSIEVGRLCDKMLKESSFNLTVGELSSRLGISESRLKVCLEIFKRLPPQFRNNVKNIHQQGKKKFGDLPETVIFSILNFNRTFRRIEDKEMTYLIEESIKRKYTTAHIRLIGLLYTTGMSLKNTISDLDNYRITRCEIVVLKTEFADVMKKEKTRIISELYPKIIRKEYPNLIV